MNNITQHFTTPEFADVLAKHGIEIDTDFARAKEDTDIICARSDDKWFAIGDHAGLWLRDYQVIPAYPLAKVLNWLPKERTIKYIGYTQLLYNVGKNMAGYVSFFEGGTWKPIEKLVFDGLSEGWLTKETIIENAKQ